MLWRARLKFQLDLHLSSSVCTLKDASIGLYKEYVQQVRTKTETDPSLKDLLCRLLCEQSYCLLHFYKYEKAEACLKEAQELIDLKIEFSGKLGRRTRFQTFDIAHLTLDFESRQAKLKIDDSNSILD